MKSNKIINIKIGILVVIGSFLICICFSGCNTDPFCENNPDYTGADNLIGFMGVDIENLSQAHSLGASTVFLQIHQPTSFIVPAIAQAEDLEINIGARAKGRSYFQIGEKIDFDKLKQMMVEQFTDSNIAAQLSGYYLIDEPCHPHKWDISLQDLSRVYEICKEVDNDIVVLYNFGDLGCFNDLIQENGNANPVVDIACFTVTLKKIQDNPDYIKSMAENAAMAREIYPSIKIVPLIAVYSSNGSGKIHEMPASDHILEITEQILAEDDFDGIMFFPWKKSKYMLQSIEDIANDSLYIDTFKFVFESAKWKYNTKKY
ncbi:MAG: hypothetical protein K8S14_01300 [Actinomycetia bacterium]|nr:hypothetical protein [Actinomycetes bacterium]